KLYYPPGPKLAPGPGSRASSASGKLPGCRAVATDTVAARLDRGEGVVDHRRRIEVRGGGRRGVVVGHRDRGPVAGTGTGVDVEHADPPRVRGVRGPDGR